MEPDSTTPNLVRFTAILHREILASWLLTRKETQYLSPWSTIYICPGCGELWAKIVRGDQTDGLPAWKVVNRYCSKHMSKMWSEALCGCFLDDYQVTTTNYLYPRAIIINDLFQRLAFEDQLRGKTKA